MSSMAKVSTSEERAFRWVATLFLAFIFMATLFESIDFQRHLRAQDDTVSWEPVNATVVSSEVVWVDCGDEGCRILPKIVYQYDIDGMTTVSERITFPWECVSDDRLLDEQQWQVVDDFPVGANVTAYVDPDNREESVLFIGMMGEPDIYSIVQDQFDSTVPFVFISPVLYFVAIRFISPIIRARTSGGSEGGGSGTSDGVSYWSSDSPAEKREKEAVEQQWIHRPEQIGQKASTAPAVQPSGAGAAEPVSEQKEGEIAPFWADP